MAKKCSKCGFANNPDDAHYCGKCGANIASNNHVWKVYDSTQFRTYNSNGYSIVPDARLSELRSYENKVENSFWNRTKEILGDFWEGIKDAIIEDKWEWIILCVIFFGCIVFYFRYMY